jgi:hypothetical protein
MRRAMAMESVMESMVIAIVLRLKGLSDKWRR